MSKIHELKTWPRSYEALDDGRKRFEYRVDDRGFQVGDLLRLTEWDPDVGRCTGRQMDAWITYILRSPDHGMRAGYVAMSLKVKCHRVL